MGNSLLFQDYRTLKIFQPERYGKATLFENEYVLVGLNCLEAGQSMEKHAHQVQTRFYLVLEGSGMVWVGDEKQDVGPGMAVWVPPANSHRIENSGSEQMVLLVGIAPAHAD